MPPEKTLSFEIEGVNQLAEALRFAGVRASQLGAAALFQEGETIMAAAKGQTPVDTGALWTSGHVAPPEVHGGRTTVTLGFGGPAAPYAVFVHEDLQARHAVGNAKFLERPFLAAARGMAERLGAAMARSLGR